MVSFTALTGKDIDLVIFCRQTVKSRQYTEEKQLYSDTIPLDVAAMAHPHAGIVSRVSAVWDGVVGDLIRKAPTEPHELAITPTMNTLFLTRCAARAPVIKRNRHHGDLVLTHPGWLLNLVAAGDTLATIVPEGMPKMDRLAIAITPGALQRLELRTERLELVSAVGIQEPLERQLVQALATEIESPSRNSRLYAESLTLVLMIALVRNYSTKAPLLPSAQFRGSLAPWQLRRVIDYFEQNLAEDISLSQLATQVGLSQSHFSRAFRTSTGLPPHQYQLAARIERAKDLLLRGTLPLIEIAAACGFSDQSHLARAFRARVGVSPGAWRRERRS